MIRAVIAQEINTGRRVRIAGRWFADCTGDAAVGALAGADFEIEPKGHMGPCNLWNVCECTDTNAINTAVVAKAEPQPFPRCPWALDLTDKPFPGRSKTKPDTNKLGGWYWESGFDRDPIAEMEYVRDWNFRAMYGAWDAMKNVDQVLPNHRLNWAAHILGKRESRRLMGDVVLVLRRSDERPEVPRRLRAHGLEQRPAPARSQVRKGLRGRCLHRDGPFRPISRPSASDRPFWIPYRCLYSRNVANLFMAGRDISVKHDALGAVRVMRTGGCMGEIVGMAASLCKKHDATAARRLRTPSERTPGPDAPRRRQESRREFRVSAAASQDSVSSRRFRARLAGEGRSESGTRGGRLCSGRFQGGVFSGPAQRRQGRRGRQQRPLAEHGRSAARGRIRVEGAGHDRRRAHRLGILRRHGLRPRLPTSFSSGTTARSGRTFPARQ